MKKLASVLLILAMLACSACGRAAVTDETTSAPETAAAPEETARPETTTSAPETAAPPEPEKKAEFVLYENGKVDFTLVYADAQNAKYAKALNDRIFEYFKIRLPMSNSAFVDPEKNKIITIGEVENVSITPPLVTRGDFAIKVGDNVVSLNAANDLAYEFLFDYLENKLKDIISRDGDERIVLTSDDDILYSSSALFDTTYVDYRKAANGNVTLDFSLKICEEYVYYGRYGIDMPYRLYLPSNYTEGKEYPVFVYLHGAGHRGNDNYLPMSNHVFNFFNHENVPMDEAIVLVPQCPSNMQWVNQPWKNGNYNLKDIPESVPMKTVVALINEIKETYSTDENRYYIYGMSMGGFGVWDIIARHPRLFAAAYPICGGGPEDAVFILKDIPIWTIHSDDDATVPFAGTERMVKLITEAGGTKIRFTRLTGYGHAIGTIGTTNSEVFEWLFAQNRKEAT